MLNTTSTLSFPSLASMIVVAVAAPSHNQKGLCRDAIAGTQGLLIFLVVYVLMTTNSAVLRLQKYDIFLVMNMTHAWWAKQLQ